MIRCALSSDPFWCLWGLLPVWAQWGIVGCIMLMIGGLAWRLYDIAKKFGGWPAAAGALGILGIIVAVFWPKKGQAPVHTDDIFVDPDKPRRKHRPTIFDSLK